MDQAFSRNVVEGRCDAWASDLEGVKQIVECSYHLQSERFFLVLNFSPVRKKSEDIHLCVDFRNLNRTSDNNNYPVSSME